MLLRSLFSLCLLGVCCAPATAQLNDKWTAFELSPAALPSGATLSDDDHETDLDWADLDADGDVDLVVVRKKPFTTLAGRSNVLLLNEAGVLVDRSANLAVASDVLGDLGFLAPTNDRDVVLADLTGDGLPEVVTSPEQTLGLPKHLNHPRVYLNRGGVGAGWLGLRFEDARFPQLFHLANGTALVPRFAAVDAGDLNADGALDLYFGDHDTGLMLFGPLQPGPQDTDDRVLLNDGNGFFSDGTTATVLPPMIQSGFCNSVELADMNADGLVDIVKQTTYQQPPILSIAYNDPAAPGSFSVADTGPLPSPYFVNTGDLNSDGRLDLVITQNANDIVLFNTGNDAAGLADLGLPVEMTLLSGVEPTGNFGFSYSSNNLIADLDGDGWGEVLIADLDPEVAEYAPDFRLHLYHNRGGTPGGSDIELLEERGSASDAGWIGAFGLGFEDLRWTHDVAVFDLDGDARQDLILSRREGTQVWLQRDPPVCQTDLGFAGEFVIEVCGGDLSSGEHGTLAVLGGAPLTPTFVGVGALANPTPLVDFGVTVVPFPPSQILTLATDVGGGLELAVPGGLGPAVRVVQAFQTSPTGLPLTSSNAVQVQFLQ